MKIKTFISGILLVASFILSADNLIKNSELDNHFFAEEFRNSGSTDLYPIDIYQEQKTDNNCLRLKVKGYLKRNGKRWVQAGVIIGGSSQYAGFPVKPNTTYNFSVKLKGTSTRAYIDAVEWAGKCRYYKDRRHLKTTVGEILVQKNWTVYQGCFKTTATGKRAALHIRLWSDETYSDQLKDKPGDYLLIDGIVIERNNKPLHQPQTHTAPKNKESSFCGIVNIEPSQQFDWSKALTLGDFKTFKAKSNAEVQTSVKILADNKSLYLRIKCLEPAMKKLKAAVKEDGGNPWQDDAVEVLIGDVSNDRTLSQFVISAGGGKWYGNGYTKVDNYDKWSAKVTYDNDSWTCNLTIPFSTLGKAVDFKPGTEIFINIARQRLASKEYSSSAPVKSSFLEVHYFPFFILGSLNDLRMKLGKKLTIQLNVLDDSSARNRLANSIKSFKESSIEKQTSKDIYDKYHSLKQAITALRFKEQPFAVTSVLPTQQFTLPLELENIDLGEGKITLKAAINEIKALPVVISNLTAKPAAYRVVLGSLSKNKLVILPQLNGPAAPSFTLREALMVKDDDSVKHGNRFDPLVKMNEANVVTVAPYSKAVVWVEFNCENTNAGIYNGILRIIPLNEKGQYLRSNRSWKFNGKMRDIALEITILPITLTPDTVIPYWFMREAPIKTFFDASIAADGSIFRITPYYFNYKFDADGNLSDSYRRPKLEKVLKTQLAFAKEHRLDGKIKFVVGYDNYRVFKQYFANHLKYGSKEWANAWSNWLKAASRAIEEAGVKPEQYMFTACNEPGPSQFEQVYRCAEIFKKVLPNIKSIYAHGLARQSLADLKKINPYIDIWCIWGNNFDDAEYIKFFLQQRDDGKDLWIYRCYADMRRSTHSYYRLMAWSSFLFNVKAAAIYNLVEGMLSGDYGDASWKQTLDGSLLYRCGQQAIPSIRYKCLIAGNYDIKYLVRLQELAQQAKRMNRATTLVAKAEKLLRDGPYQAFMVYRHDKTQPEKIKKQAIELILKLQEACSGN